MVPPEFTVKEPVMFRLIYLSATHGEAVSVFAEWVMLPPDSTVTLAKVAWPVVLEVRVPVTVRGAPERFKTPL